MTGFPELISWKTAAIPFGWEDEAFAVSELKCEADGGGGGAGEAATVFPVALHTGPNEW